jgi:Fic family protein
MKGLRKNPERFLTLVKVAQRAVGDGKYLHWDKLRYHEPPSGLSHEEWWAALKMARNASAKLLPLGDTNGRPFQYCLPDPAQEHLHRIAQDAGGHIEVPDGAITNPETRDRYIVRSLMEEAITSSQIEGASTTRVVAKEMIRSARKPRDRSERMILNNYRAMHEIRQLRNKPLTPQVVLRLHALLTDGTLTNPSAVGRLRRADEPIHVLDERDNVLLHRPPPAEELPGRVQAMCDFANGQTPEYWLQPVVRAIVLHFWLAYDHPFVDGNGRCARALFYWSMLRQGYWLCEFISISGVIRKARAYSRYERAFLYTETDDNDLTYFILYHLELILRAIKELHTTVARKAEEIRQIERITRASAGFNHRQLALLSHALRHADAEYTVRSHQTSHNVVHQTARSDLYDLAQKGLLEQRKISRTYYFTPARGLERKLRALR